MTAGLPLLVETNWPAEHLRWQMEGSAVSSAACTYPPARFEVKWHPERIATKDEVKACFDMPQCGLVNALPLEAFCYCCGGAAACSDAFILTLLGASNVAVYDGSLYEWATDPDLPLQACR